MPREIKVIKEIRAIAEEGRNPIGDVVGKSRSAIKVGRKAIIGQRPRFTTTPKTHVEGLAAHKKEALEAEKEAALPHTGEEEMLTRGSPENERGTPSSQGPFVGIRRTPFASPKGPPSLEAAAKEAKIA